MRNKKIYELRKLFLRSFIESLIVNYKIKYKIETPYSYQKERQKKSVIENSDSLNEKEEKPDFIEWTPSITNHDHTAQEIPISKDQTNEDVIIPSVVSQLTGDSLNDEPKNFMSERKLHVMPFEKITNLLRDPKVLSIECPGPGRNLIVYKNRITQTTPYILEQEEIEEVLREISEKTRIPIIGGLFKAKMASIIITAVISEFAGTRFVIEKGTLFTTDMKRPVPRPSYFH